MRGGRLREVNIVNNGCASLSGNTVCFDAQARPGWGPRLMRDTVSFTPRGDGQSLKFIIHVIVSLILTLLVIRGVNEGDILRLHVIWWGGRHRSVVGDRGLPWGTWGLWLLLLYRLSTGGRLCTGPEAAGAPTVPSTTSPPALPATPTPSLPV